MFDEENLSTSMSFGELVKNFKIREDELPIFEEYVNLTSKLIKRPYFHTFKLVEDWELHTIIRRYNDCMNYVGEIPKDVLWWSIRKKDK